MFLLSVFLDNEKLYNTIVKYPGIIYCNINGKLSTISLKSFIFFHLPFLIYPSLTLYLLDMYLQIL